MIDYRIGRKIKKYRKELELTQEQFCIETSIFYEYII